jgi:hypothetical protein
MSNKLLSDLDTNSQHQGGRPFDPTQVREDFRLYGRKKRAETLDIVRARLDHEETGDLRSYATVTRLYTDLRAEHERLLKNDL